MTDASIDLTLNVDHSTASTAAAADDDMINK